MSNYKQSDTAIMYDGKQKVKGAKDDLYFHGDCHSGVFKMAAECLGSGRVRTKCVGRIQ